MSAVNNLLDKYREARSIASDSALAESLHITRQGVHQWRKGLSWPSEDHVIAMATAIGEPAERWFVAINADRASPAARKVWLRLAQAAAAFAMIYLFSHLDVQMHDAFLASSLYIMRNCGIVLILALAACAAWESKEKQHHARILEP